MASRRLHYAILNMFGDTEMTYKEDGGVIRVLFEQGVYGGFRDAVFTIDGELECNKGFCDKELLVFKDIVLRCANRMKETLREEGYTCIY